MSLPGQFLRTRAGRVFVHRSGRGAPLVLVHGWLMSHWYFRPVIEELAREREVIALDLPGHGESDRPPPHSFRYALPSFVNALAETLDQLEPRMESDRFDLVGHSMGGGVALSFAARHPERVARLALICPVVYPISDIPLSGKLALLPSIGELLFRNVINKSEFARNFRQQSVRDGRVLDDQWIDYYWERFNRAGGRDAGHSCLRMMSELDNANSDPGRLRSPTLIVWGDEDRLVPLANGKRLARAIAGAELRIVPACGHMPFIERYEEFMRQLRPFLEGPLPATNDAPTPVPVARTQRLSS